MPWSRAKWYATESPMMPAPITTTSAPSSVTRQSLASNPEPREVKAQPLAASLLKMASCRRALLPTIPRSFPRFAAR